MSRVVRQRLQLPVIAVVLFLPTYARSGVIQMSFGRDVGSYPVETCPQLELALDTVLQTPPPMHHQDSSCGCANGVDRHNVRLMPMLPYTVSARSVTRLQSAVAVMSLLCVVAAILGFLWVFFFANVNHKSRAMKRTMRPAMGVAKQWASDLSDVFVVFPCKGFQYLLHVMLVVPFRSLHGLGSGMHAAWKTRLQQKLLEEAEQLSEGVKKAKAAKQSERSTGSSQASPGVAQNARKGKQKAGLPGERKKDVEVSAPHSPAYSPAKALSFAGRSPESTGSAGSASPEREARRKTSSSVEELSRDEVTRRKASSLDAPAEDVAASGSRSVASDSVLSSAAAAVPASSLSNAASSSAGPRRGASEQPQRAQRHVEATDEGRQAKLLPSAEEEVAAASPPTTSEAPPTKSPPPAKSAPRKPGVADAPSRIASAKVVPSTTPSARGSNGSTAADEAGGPPEASSAPSPIAAAAATVTAAASKASRVTKAAEEAPHALKLAGTGGSGASKAGKVRSGDADEVQSAPVPPRARAGLGGSDCSSNSGVEGADKKGLGLTEEAARKARDADNAEEAPPPPPATPPPTAPVVDKSTVAAAKAKVDPPPFPPPGLPTRSDAAPTAEGISTTTPVKHPPPTKAPPPPTKPDVKAAPTAARKLRNLGPPPSGMAPPPPPIPGGKGIAEPAQTAPQPEMAPPPPPPVPPPAPAKGTEPVSEPESPPPPKPVAKPPPRLSPPTPSAPSTDSVPRIRWEKKTSANLLKDALALDDDGAISGGTGGSVDLGPVGEKVIEMIGQHADKKAAAKKAATKAPPKAPPTASSTGKQCDGVAGGSIAVGGPLKDEDGKDLALQDDGLIMAMDMEAMVEDLAGINSFDSGQDVGINLPLLEDALGKVDAARDALSRMIPPNNTLDFVPGQLLDDSDLRVSAPAFVPGQMWTGSQISSFVD